VICRDCEVAASRCIPCCPVKSVDAGRLGFRQGTRRIRICREVRAGGTQVAARELGHIGQNCSKRGGPIDLALRGPADEFAFRSRGAAAGSGPCYWP
jgi:hypothetical protein